MHLITDMSLKVITDLGETRYSSTGIQMEVGWNIVTIEILDGSTINLYIANHSNLNGVSDTVSLDTPLTDGETVDTYIGCTLLDGIKTAMFSGVLSSVEVRDTSTTIGDF